jgi:DnaJ-related protein SCJ1
VVPSTSTITVSIDRGIPEGTDVVFENEADESPDYVAGDVVVRVRSKRTLGGWVRKGSNLYLSVAIDLAEALLGFQRNVTHLDGHALPIGRKGVTQPGPVRF